MKNFLTIHYNTPKLTEYLVKSINKNVGPDCRIYIFDNSDKLPFTYKQDNLIVLDNTRGYIVNFNEELAKYPDREKSLGKFSKWGSFKHCISVDKCFDLIDDNFILFDSDVLLKRDISELFDDDIYACGEINDWFWNTNGNYTQIPKERFPHHPRLLPFMTYINVKKCKAEGIRYFDANHMDGIANTITKDATDAEIERDSWDTGCWLYEKVKNKPIKEVKVEDYIVHFGHASWSKTGIGKTEKLTVDQWLKKYESCYKQVDANNKKVVYTCITGGYDKLLEPTFVTSDFDYVCYTDDKNITSNVWEIRMIPDSVKNLDNKRINRYIKTHPHEFFKEYDVSIYVDGSILVKSDMNIFLNKQCNSDDVIYVPTHPTRKCIYKEGDTCIKIKKDTKETIDEQMQRYRDENFPENYGLTQNNIIIRKHNNPTCIKVMEDWWEEIRNHSYRDQLSFMYAIWKTPDIKLKKLDKSTCNSTYFKWYSRHEAKNSTTSPKTTTPTNKNVTIVNTMKKPEPIIKKQEPTVKKQEASAIKAQKPQQRLLNIQLNSLPPQPKKEAKPKEQPVVHQVHTVKQTVKKNSTLTNFLTW